MSIDYGTFSLTIRVTAGYIWLEVGYTVEIKQDYNCECRLLAYQKYPLCDDQVNNSDDTSESNDFLHYYRKQSTIRKVDFEEMLVVKQ